MSSNRGPFGLGRGRLMRAGNSLDVVTRVATRHRRHRRSETGCQGIRLDLMGSLFWLEASRESNKYREEGL